MSEKRFNTIMHWGPDDDGEITNVITSDTEIPDNIEETLVSKFSGLFHNDLNGRYWSYDIPLGDGKVLEFRDFKDNESIMYWELVDTNSDENKEVKTEYYKMPEDEHIIWDSEVDYYDEDYMEEIKNNQYQEYLDELDELDEEEPEDFETWYESYVNGSAEFDSIDLFEDLKENVLPEIDKQLNNDILLLRGNYGSNYTDFKSSGKGGKIFVDGTDDFRNYMSGFDRVCITTQNGVLGAILADHDGTVSGQFYTIPSGDKFFEMLKLMNYEDRVREDYYDEDIEKYGMNDLMKTIFNEDQQYDGLEAKDFEVAANLLIPIKDTISGYSQKNESKILDENRLDYILKNPEFQWLDNDTFIMTFGYSRDDDGWYNYMVEYWLDDNSYHFLKVYEYDTIEADFTDEEKEQLKSIIQNKINKEVKTEVKTEAKVNKLDEFLDEMEYNYNIQMKGENDPLVAIGYIIERLEGILIDSTENDSDRNVIRKYLDELENEKETIINVLIKNGEDTEDWYDVGIDIGDIIKRVKALRKSDTNNLGNKEVKEEAKFKDKVKAIKKRLKQRDKRLSDKTAQKSAERIAGSMIKNESEKLTYRVILNKAIDGKLWYCVVSNSDIEHNKINPHGKFYYQGKFKTKKEAEEYADKLQNKQIKNESIRDSWEPNIDLYTRQINEIADNLGISKNEIQKEGDSIKFRYNGKVYFAEPVSVFQVDVFDDNHKQIGYGVNSEKIKEEVFTEYTENDYIYELVGGEYAGTYTREEAEKLPIKEPELTDNLDDVRANGGFVHRKELDNQLQFKGYLGPMWNGTKDGKGVIRYETQEVYDMLSEEKKLQEDKEIIERPEDILKDEEIEEDEEDKAIHHNEDGTNKTILDYLEDRVGQEIEVGRLNTILQSIFGMYQHIFIMPEDLYNMDLDYTQTLTVNLDGEEYNIYYDIIDVDSGIVKIVEVEEI